MTGKKKNKTNGVLESAFGSPAMDNFIEQINETNRRLESAFASPTMDSFIKQINETNKRLESAFGSPAMDSFIKQINETHKTLESTVNYLPIESIQEMGSIVQKTAFSIPNFTELISTIDWDEIDFTENDVKEAREIINQEDIEHAIYKELNKSKDTSQPTNSISVIITLFTIINFFINGVLYVDLFLDLANNEIIPAVESISSSKQKKKLISMKQKIKHIHKSLKKKVPIYIWSSLGIVIKKGLSVYEKKRLDSTKKGKLDAPVVVKIITQNRNWIYISLEDSAGNSILEGWTLTRYIKKLK